MPLWYRAMCAATIVGGIWLGVIAGRNGQWWLMLLPIVVSPVAMWLLRQTTEHGQPSGMFSPKTQSWAFLFGDTVFLPMAFLGGALAWRTIGVSTDRWYGQHWWIVISVTAGLVAGWAFRTFINAPEYHKAGLGSLLDSPTSIWHDFVVYPVLVAVFMAICLPAAIHDFTGYGWLVVVGLFGWLAMAACDATIHQLDPANLHPPVEETIFRR